MMRNCHRSQSIDRRRGFTLIELLVVIAIIAVLGGLTALGYRGVANDSKLASGKNTVSAVLDLARGLAMKNSRPTMVMFVPRLVARGDCRTQVVIAEWTGDVIEQTVVIPPPVGTNAPRLFERFVPVANVQPRLLPKGITVAGPLITADYSTEYGPLQPAQTIMLRFRATITSTLAIGTRITNTGVVKWNDPPQTASASVSIDVGGISGVGILNGTAWHDANFNGVIDVNERLLEGWTVELYRNAQLTHSALTDANGVYQISGVVPNYATADRYELRFLAPGAGANTAKLGRAQSIFTNDLQRISDIVVQPGSNLQNLNLPIEPNGVIYNTISRTPIAGAILRMLQAGNQTPLPESCFYDPAQQGQVTLASGYYRFDINFSDPACPNGGSFLIAVAAPSANHLAGYSQIIPPTSGPATVAFSALRGAASTRRRAM